MGQQFNRDTKDVVDEALESLERANSPKVSQPLFFFTISKKTQFMVNVQIVETADNNLDEILMAIIDFLDENPRLDEGNIFLTMYMTNSILMETQGNVLFAEVFSGDVERPHYKGFHRIVKYILKTFGELPSWDGEGASLPRMYLDNVRTHILTGKEIPRTVDGVGDKLHGKTEAPSIAMKKSVENDIIAGTSASKSMEYYENKMKEWYLMGYNIDALKGVLHEDHQSITRAFQFYEKKLAKLHELSRQIDEMEHEGFDEAIRGLKTLCKDPRNIGELEKGVAALREKFRIKYSIVLPICDEAGLTNAIKNLPLGIPSSLWGIPLPSLVKAIISAERGLTTDGTPIIMLKGKWYHADSRAKDFLTVYDGKVRTQKDVLAEKSKLKGDRLDDMLEVILNKSGIDKNG
jgi:hypothetical protein